MCDNILKPKVHFTPIVRWRELHKINVYGIYTLMFLTTIGFHDWDSWNVIKQKKLKK